MSEMINGRQSGGIRRAAIAVAMSAIAATGAVARPFNSLVVVAPSELPDLARETGEAMLLHETADGKTLLYVEQKQGARLAIFDVTDPAHVKDEGSVQVDASGPYDFVLPLGGQTELLRFRGGEQDAVLDLRNARLPSLKSVPGMTAHGPVTRLGNDGFAVSTQFPSVQSLRDYQVVDSTNPQGPYRVIDVKQVRQEIAKRDTGTTFLLADKGLYLIRQPSVEAIHQFQTISPN